MASPSYSPFDSPEHELAWAAGLFEGEGTIFAAKASRGAGFYPRIQLASTDLDVIERFASIIGYGKVMGPYDKNGSQGLRPKPIYFWKVGKRDEFEVVLDMLWPFLCERRQQQAREVFEKVSPLTHPERAPVSR